MLNPHLEPLRIFRMHPTAPIDIWDAKGRSVNTYDDDVAERIVRCWNACMGIPTDILREFPARRMDLYKFLKTHGHLADDGNAVYSVGEALMNEADKPVFAARK